MCYNIFEFGEICLPFPHLRASMSCAIAVIRAANPIIAFAISSMRLLIFFFRFFFIGLPPF